MSQKTRKRFIAGATCPSCKAMDTLMLYLENNVEHVECVQCGHKQTQPDEKVSASTRVQESVIGVFKP
ncbi:YheV family putative zinc ribbon protein [Aliiglaciecola sp. CAU 1673]|uniref:YheV family putative zinc ribbon protein n=1 Tax=Aliiglaciecola sp. CAU 1673 TaxID=3032595 RepID=UPI0023DB2BCE|nr:YheV family putative zinc ribbon protein [Aliiglaciecola sp. CAU 1673]MDF2179235.1 YheV family putative zinc ribbon protein [Aliiglaciecola sp. CAU 1673]